MSRRPRSFRGDSQSTFCGPWPNHVLCPWMKLPVDFFEPCLIDVSVDLRRGDAGVAEKLLNLAEVGSAGEQVGGEAMAEGVGANVGAGADAADVAFDEQPNCFAPQPFAAAREQ